MVLSPGWGESGDGARTGNVTNIHITDVSLDGPLPRELCLLPNLRELDIDGGHFTGPIPDWLKECFPGLQELDLSYNRVSPQTAPYQSVRVLLSQWPLLYLTGAGSASLGLGFSIKELAGGTAFSIVST